MMRHVPDRADRGPWTIGVLARRGGVHVETIRYYERRGLLERPSEQTGRIRRYGRDAERRLSFIRRAQALGFSLGEIGELLALGDHACAETRERAEQKIDMIDAKLADLKHMRAALHALTLRCGQGTTDCPMYRDLTGMANQGPRHRLPKSTVRR